MKRKISLSFSDFEAAMNGDLTSAIKMLSVARALCSAVEDFRRKKPEVAKTIARNLPDWPALVARHKASIKRIGPLLIELELAEDHPGAHVLAYEGKNMNLDDELNAVALEIWEWMNRFRRPTFSDRPDSILFRALPEFSLKKEVFQEWWDLGWAYFLRSIGGNPFDDLRLKAVSEEKNKDGFRRLEAVANSQGVTVESRIATEVRKAARKLWPRMAGLTDRIKG